MLMKNWLPMKSVTGVPHEDNTKGMGKGLGYSPLGQVGVHHPGKVDNKPGEARIAEIAWGGWACTYWSYDPGLDLVYIWFAQFPDLPDWTEAEDPFRAAVRAITMGKGTSLPRSVDAPKVPSKRKANGMEKQQSSS